MEIGGWTWETKNFNNVYLNIVLRNSNDKILQKILKTKYGQKQIFPNNLLGQFLENINFLPHAKNQKNLGLRFSENLTENTHFTGLLCYARFNITTKIKIIVLIFTAKAKQLNFEITLKVEPYHCLHESDSETF